MTSAATAPKPFRASLDLRIKWATFRLLETLSVKRSGAPISPVTNPEPPASHRSGSLWLYVSTIGELNAVEPFLELLLKDVGQLPLTLVSDRRVYRDSYRRKYPHAYVYEIDGTSTDIDRLASLTPPRLFVIAEIPCLLSDAPCRLPFAAVYAAKRSGARVALVNGWIYDYPPPSRMDGIERSLLGRHFLGLMDTITVQTEQVRTRLIAEGASEQAVHVTGNTKFDALKNQPWSPAGRPSARLLEGIIASGRPCVVAGCVTDFDDQTLILEAFEQVRRRMASALLVLAPRHPEQTERLQQLNAYLDRQGVVHRNRSRMEDAPLPDDVTVLVLDTMGELRDFYAASTVSFVGRDHNILEPMAFGKPVTVLPGWESTFPSYPVYRLAMESRAISSAADASELSASWLEAMDRASGERRQVETLAFVNNCRGAAERNLQVLRLTHTLPVATAA